MTRDRLRELERRWGAARDPELDLRCFLERVRSGVYGLGEIEAAAFIGYLPARAFLGLAPGLEDLGVWINTSFYSTKGYLQPGRRLSPPPGHERRRARFARIRGASERIAAALARRALVAWERERPLDHRPRRAIAAAELYLSCPCQDHEIPWSILFGDMPKASSDFATLAARCVIWATRFIGRATREDHSSLSSTLRYAVWARYGSISAVAEDLRRDVLPWLLRQGLAGPREAKAPRPFGLTPRRGLPPRQR